MSTNAQTPAKRMRDYTSPVRDTTAALQRLQDQYFAALKRAEAIYFEGVRRVTDAVTQQAEPVNQPGHINPENTENAPNSQNA
jgi:hypothetical protein